MKVTYIGHATCLLEMGGKKILTDPNWARNIFFLKRLQEPGLQLQKILPVNVVLISHSHFDHLNFRTLKQLDRRTPIVCASRLSGLLRRRGFTNIRELAWWESVEIDGLTITAVPAEHFGGRWQFWDRHLGYCGFVVSHGGEHVYFAGDTAYGDFFKTIGEMFSLKVALLPIAAYAGPGKMDFLSVHLNPEQAIQAFNDLRAKYFVPIHFGTFRLSTEPVEEPEQRLRWAGQQHLDNGQLHILQSGKTLELK